MKSDEIKVVQKYVKNGYDCIRNGIPDIIVLKEGKLSFIEVKFLEDKLTPSQERAFMLFKKHGITAKIERVKYREIITDTWPPPSIIEGLTDEERKELDKHIEDINNFTEWLNSPKWLNSPTIKSNIQYKTVIIDPRNRITIPQQMLQALKIDPTKTQGYPVTLELYPLDNPTCIIIKKTWTPTPDPPGIP